MEGETDAVLQALTEYYESSGNNPKFKEIKEAVFRCIFDLLFADLAAGGGRSDDRLIYRPRTLALLRFLDRLKLGWPDDEGRPRAVKLMKFAEKARQGNKDEPDFVFDIDRAIANGPGGLREVIRDNPEMNAEANVNRKIGALTEIMDRGDYRDGPLEILVRDLLSVAYEESAMIAAARGNEAAAASLAGKAIEQLRGALAAATDRRIVNRSDIVFFFNDFRFRMAVLQRLIGDESWVKNLVPILNSSVTWNDVRDLDHVYVRSFIRWPPQEVYVTGAKLGAVGISAPVNAFFNPGQIALYLCGWQDESADIWTRAERLNGYLSLFNNRDYRVYIRSSRKVGDLGKLADRYDAELRKMWDAIESAIAKPPPGMFDNKADWLAVVKRGAQRCGVSPATLANIYASMEQRVRGTWEGDNAGRSRTHGIYVGGFLSRGEADQLVIELQKFLDLKQEPYVARPKISG